VSRFRFVRYVGEDGGLERAKSKWFWWERVFRRQGLWPLGECRGTLQDNPLVLRYTHGYVSLSRRTISVIRGDKKFSFPRAWLFISRYEGLRVGTNLARVGAGLALLVYQKEIWKQWCEVARQVHDYYRSIEWVPAPGIRQFKTIYGGG